MPPLAELKPAMLTDTQALARLKRATAEAVGSRTLTTWAAEHGVSYTMLQDVLNGRRKISPSIAKAIGLKRVHGWEEK